MLPDIDIAPPNRDCLEDDSPVQKKVGYVRVLENTISTAAGFLWISIIRNGGLTLQMLGLIKKKSVEPGQMNKHKKKMYGIFTYIYHIFKATV